MFLFASSYLMILVLDSLYQPTLGPLVYLAAVTLVFHFYLHYKFALLVSVYAGMTCTSLVVPFYLYQLYQHHSRHLILSCSNSK